MSSGDELKLNLLYEYSQVRCGHRQRLSPFVLGEDACERTQNVLYLVRFILCNVLLLNSREEAEEYFKDNPEDLKDYKLETLIMKSDYIKVGKSSIRNYDFVFRLVYGDIKNFEDMRTWALKQTPNTKNCILKALDNIAQNA